MTQAPLIRKVKITQVSSLIGCSATQKSTVLSLGLNKINSAKVFEDSSSIAGMVKKVKHLVSVEVI